MIILQILALGSNHNILEVPFGFLILYLIRVHDAVMLTLRHLIVALFEQPI